MCFLLILFVCRGLNIGPKLLFVAFRIKYFEDTQVLGSSLKSLANKAYLEHINILFNE